MVIYIKYFASLREAAGCGKETLEAAEASTVRDVWRTVRSARALPGGALCAVNQTHANDDTILKDGDEVAFFPNITGG